MMSEGKRRWYEQLAREGDEAAQRLRDRAITARRAQLRREWVNRTMDLDYLLSVSKYMTPIDRYFWLCRQGFYVDNTKRGESGS